MNKDILIENILSYKFDLEKSKNINSFLIPNLEKSISESTFEDVKTYIVNSWLPDDISEIIVSALKILFKENKEKFELQCAISILIPLFDKIIRVLCQFNNIITTNRGREEKTLGILLQNKELKTILGESNWKYIKFVLLEDGLDLRDYFSHGFDQDLYKEEILEILFIIIIKISSIKI